MLNVCPVGDAGCDAWVLGEGEGDGVDAVSPPQAAMQIPIATVATDALAVEITARHRVPDITGEGYWVGPGVHPGPTISTITRAGRRA
jgi:hypothetical protein